MSNRESTLISVSRAVEVIFITAAFACVFWLLTHPEPAKADGLITPFGLFVPAPPADAKIITIPDDNSPAAASRYRRWRAFCKPVETLDAFGVIRLTYAKPGCEFGRDH